MANVEIYTKDWCGFCRRAKDLLDRRGQAYTEIDVTNDHLREAEMLARAGRSSVPQIFIDGVHLGGNDALYSAHVNGALEEVLGPPANRAA